MGLWDIATRFFALEAFQESVQLRDATLEDLLQRATGQLRVDPWRRATIREALGVPAIYRCVSLISNTMGQLSLEAWRNEVKLAPTERPRLIIRPNPFTIPRDFARDTGWNMASCGEAWWWIAARDADDAALSLINVPPQEIQVTEDPKDLRFPIIEWRGRKMPNRDMVQLTLNRLPGDLRGSGPLQICGAAVSVAVEAQQWAANFYAEGGVPSIWIKSAVELDDIEAQAMKDKWAEGSAGVPRVTSPNVDDIKQFEVNTEASSMFEARDFQNAEAARMFGVGASLLDVPIGGSSLTYQNLEQEFTKFIKTCLQPNYLEPFQQSMNDLLTRATTCRFNLGDFNRPDPKTRAEVYEKVVPLGIISVPEARQIEGYEPGDVEVAPVPPAPPAAIPASLPIQGRSGAAMHCTGCDKLLAESAGPGTHIRCPRCKELNVVEPETRAEPVVLPAPPPPVINFHEGAFQAGDVNMPATEEVRAAADRAETAAERIDRAEQVYLQTLRELREEQDRSVAAMKVLAEELKPRPVTRRVLRDEHGKIIGVEEVPVEQLAQ